MPPPGRVSPRRWASVSSVAAPVADRLSQGSAKSDAAPSGRRFSFVSGAAFCGEGHSQEFVAGGIVTPVPERAEAPLAGQGLPQAGHQIRRRRRRQGRDRSTIAGQETRQIALAPVMGKAMLKQGGDGGPGLIMDETPEMTGETQDKIPLLTFI